MKVQEASAVQAIRCREPLFRGMGRAGLRAWAWLDALAASLGRAMIPAPVLVRPCRSRGNGGRS